MLAPGQIYSKSRRKKKYLIPDQNPALTYLTFTARTADCAVSEIQTAAKWYNTPEHRAHRFFDLQRIQVAVPCAFLCRIFKTGLQLLATAVYICTKQPCHMILPLSEATMNSAPW